MTKFEEVGCNYQREACSKEQAIKSFSISCNICCTRGINVSCDQCAIEATHKHIIAAFEELRRENGK